MKKFFMDMENIALFTIGMIILGVMTSSFWVGVGEAGKFIMTHPHNATFAILFAAVIAIGYRKTQGRGGNGNSGNYNSRPYVPQNNPSR